MAEILDFPDSLQREWRVAEEVLRSMVRQYRPDSDELEYVIERVKRSFLRHGRGCVVSAKTLDEALQQLDDWARNVISGALFDLLLCEFELYRLRGATPQ